MDRTQLLLGLSFALFALGLVGVMVRRNALVHADVHGADAERRDPGARHFLARRRQRLSGAVLVFLIFVVAAAEIAIAIPIVLQLSRQRQLARRRGLRSSQGMTSAR